MTEEQQTLSYEEPQNNEVLNEEEQDSLQVGEQLEADQEQLLAGKYKDPKDLETAYKELEKKLGEKSEPASDETESETEPEEEAPKDTEPNFLDQLWEEGTTSKITKETFDKLSKMDPVEVAKMAMQQRSQAQQVPQSREFTDKDVQQIHGLVGGEENYNNMMGWANQNVPEQEVKMYDAVMDKGDTLAAYFAVQAMALRYQDKVGKDGQLVTGKAPKQTSDVFQSQQEMVKAMEDSRYSDDPAYREAILQKLERSNINF
tara:strand:- start:188 stop:967 length:780 start_codon:yes stop_codon:yes gene_type:complete